MSKCWSCGAKVERQPNYCYGCHHVVCLTCSEKYDHIGYGGKHGRRQMAKNIRLIGGYKCGCTYGPVWQKDRLEYCGVHGDEIADEYEVPSQSHLTQPTRRGAGSRSKRTKTVAPRR